MEDLCSRPPKDIGYLFFFFFFVFSILGLFVEAVYLFLYSICGATVSFRLLESEEDFQPRRCNVNNVYGG